MNVIQNTKPPSYIIELNNTEIEILLHLANQIGIPAEDADSFCKESKILSTQIPKRIQNIVLDFIVSGSDTGFLLIRRIHIDIENIPTPSENTRKIGEQTQLAKIQSMIMHIIGEMISYEAEGYGRLFQDVVPVKSMANNQTSVGSHMELEIHTEQAFSPLRPDILSLACLRGDDTAMTYILPVQTIIENMSSDEIEMLRQPLWETGVDMSFKLHGNDFIEGDVRGPMAILNGPIDDPILIFDQDLMKGITEKSDKLIQKIVDIYYKYRISHNLTEGEIVIIDNRRAVHGRSPFFPRYDGHDRFLIRCFAAFDYNKTSYSRQNNGRMVSAIYS